MKVRFKFAKYGPIRFVGHLDLMRYFEKVTRRANIDVAMTEGFSPHQILSFANPLSLGITSDAEYVDFELKSLDLLSYEKEIPEEEKTKTFPEGAFVKIDEECSEELKPLWNVLKAMDDQSGIGFRMLSARVLHEWQKGEKKETAMSLVRGADYYIQYMKPEKLKEGEDFFGDDFWDQESYIVTREKKGERISNGHGGFKKSKVTIADVDIKPLVKDFSHEKADFLPEGTDIEKLHTSDFYDKASMHMYVRLSTGSIDNLKPEVLMQSICKFRNVEYLRSDFRIHRIEQYGQNEEGGYVALCNMNK